MAVHPNIFNHRSILGISEKELNKLSYKSILNIAFERLKNIILVKQNYIV